MGGRCQRCGSPGSPTGSPAPCGACQLSARLPAAGAPVATAACLSVAGRAGAGGDLGAILRAYRSASRLTQQQLADVLGFDRTYISMIECSRRSITDHGTLTHIARTLAIPPRMLGIADPGDADFAAMLAFGISVIRLADVARHSGQAGEAVSELWPLIIRLEARIAAGHAEPETMSLLAQARVSFGVNTFTLREVRLRGLLATGRTGPAVDLAESFAAEDGPPTPQWRVIERITTADVLARAGDEQTAADMLSAAIGDAETLRLPHQIQRIIRLAQRPGVLTGPTVREQAEVALTRLDRQLADAGAMSWPSGSTY